MANERFIKAYGFLKNICDLWVAKKITSDSAMAMVNQNCQALEQGFWQDKDGDEPWRPRQQDTSVRVVGRARTFGFGDSTFTLVNLLLPNYRGLVCLLDNDTLSRRTFTLTDINQRLQGTLSTAPAQRFDNPFILAVDTQETFQALTLERARRIANGERDRGDRD